MTNHFRDNNLEQMVTRRFKGIKLLRFIRAFLIIWEIESFAGGLVFYINEQISSGVLTLEGYWIKSAWFYSKKQKWFCIRLYKLPYQNEKYFSWLAIMTKLFWFEILTWLLKTKFIEKFMNTFYVECMIKNLFPVFKPKLCQSNFKK